MIEDSEPGLDRYLEEVRAHSRVLDNEDDLIKSVRTGDQTARKVLVESYLELTAEIGLRLAPAKMSRLTAVQEANLVLLRLIEKGTDKPAVQLGPAIQKHFARFS